MADNLPSLFGPHSSGAMAEWAKTTGKAIDAGVKAGGYLDRIFGDLPDNLVGLGVADWVRHKRIRRLAELEKETEEILQKRGAMKAEADDARVSPSIIIPIIAAATDETRAEIRQIWARLLANALDPSRSDAVRQSFVQTLKSFDPPDALFMDRAVNGPVSSTGDLIHLHEFANGLKLTGDGFIVSLQHLQSLGCIGGTFDAQGGPLRPEVAQRFTISAYGRELMRACRP